MGSTALHRKPAADAQRPQRQACASWPRGSGNMIVEAEVLVAARKEVSAATNRKQLCCIRPVMEAFAYEQLPLVLLVQGRSYAESPRGAWFHIKSWPLSPRER